jgi:AraC family transcriptional regulator, regulatory protein of adaptative response / methylated-DNA-[protein]-cysteine methyltransferase
MNLRKRGQKGKTHIGVHFSVEFQCGFSYALVRHSSHSFGLQREEEMPAMPSRVTMERAYMQSDSTYDGVFFLGVRTTGIFCRPSCGARKPQPKNVDFFATVREALFAGYRPCKRCLPLTAVGAAPAWVTRILTAVDRDSGHRLTDAQIRKMAIDPARARRFFQKNYGMTFQAYCRGRRLGQALEQIRRGERIDDVALGHGYESHSGFRGAFGKTFGTPPGKARTTDNITVAWIESPLGPLVAGATSSALVLLEFTDRRMLDAQFVTLRRIFKKPVVPGSSKVLDQLRMELEEYFAGSRMHFAVPLEFPGSEFQQRVWKGLLAIPYGKTLSYEELAERVGAPHSQRAVGHANGLNRIGIVVPCHRVVNKNGKLGGYGGGLWRKQALLDLERGERKLL